MLCTQACRPPRTRNVASYAHTRHTRRRARRIKQVWTRFKNSKFKNQNNNKTKIGNWNRHLFVNVSSVTFEVLTFVILIFSAFIFIARRSYIILCLPKISNSFEIYSKVQFEDDDDDDDEESEKSFWKQINLSKGWTTTDDFLWVFTKLGFILGYFYVCDRTNFLMKENKWVNDNTVGQKI